MTLTKSEIKAKLTKMYQLRKELNQNLINTKAALNDVNGLIEALTKVLETMEKEAKYEN